MQEKMFERQCGDCTLCCKWLHFYVEGEPVYPGKPCKYLGDNCTIHKIRPKLCRAYNCAYIQGIMPEWLKPSKTDMIVSVEKWGPNQEYQLLRAIECGKQLSVEALSWLVQYSRDNNIGLIYHLNGVWNYLGPDYFMEYFKNQRILPKTPDDMGTLQYA